MVLMKSVLLLPQPSNSINLLNEFKKFREEKRFLDISLVCENGVRVVCHSIVLATSNSFWRGVLQSLEGLGFHGIDEDSPVEILMPELVGHDVENFVNSLYDPERLVTGKGNPSHVFLLDENVVEENQNVDLSSNSTTELMPNSAKIGSFLILANLNYGGVVKNLILFKYGYL